MPPPGRVVSLPCLKNLIIHENAIHSILLNHLSIPAGASLTLDFEFTGERSPIPDLLPKSLKYLQNISSISSVNLSFEELEKYVRLDGPSGGLYMLGQRIDWEEAPIFTLDRRILRSLSQFDLSGTQRLAITQYEPPTVNAVEKSTPYHILSCTKDLRTLTLTQCNNLPFILALDPVQNPSERVLCPHLEEIILYVEGLGSFRIKELESMAKERVSAGKKLPSITIVGLDELIPGREVFKLKKYITHVDYRVKEDPPKWDNISEDGEK